MNQKYRKVLLILFISGLVSCKNLYVQKSVFVPLLQEKGDVKIEASLGREGVTLNSAYALTDEFGLMLNGFSAFQNSEQYNRKYNYNFETGIGYHVNFLDSLHYEAYIGGGLGKLNSDYERAGSDYQNYFFLGLINPVYFFFPFLFNFETYSVNGYGNYSTAFFQNTLALTSGGNSFCLTGRAQYVKFDRYYESTIIGNQNYWYEIEAPSKLFIQPVITDKIRISDRVNFVFQMGANIEVNETKEVFEWNKFFYYTGFEVKFNTRKKTKTKLLQE